MNTPIISIIFYIIAAIIGAIGQYLYKIGADKSDGTLAGYLLNAPLIGGVFCYITVMLLFVAAFKKGGEDPNKANRKGPPPSPPPRGENSSSSVSSANGLSEFTIM